MLKEKSAYKEDLPVNVTVANVVDYPIHFHNDLEVVYVLDGSVRMKNGYYNYILKQGDIFILNAREIHSFESNGEKNMVMMLQLDTDYFSRYYENLRNSFFVTDMEDDSDESLDVLRTLLARIMMEILEKGYGYEAKVIESTHNLLSNLFADFQYYLMEDGKFVNGTKNKGNKILAGRLSRITDYMYENYTRKLTLNEIAEREHLSIYYLSHVIKEATGLSFQELLSFIRVEESEKLLLGTNKKIGAIAEETGFSAVRYYIKHFETWFGMHPLEYRKRYTGKVASVETSYQMDK
ncbi:MAG: AraC family transcriptional regulator, partial [Anaerovoracaceae bacterium]